MKKVIADLQMKNMIFSEKLAINKFEIFELTVNIVK